MPLDVKTLVAAIGTQVSFVERRSPAQRTDYFEGVLTRQEFKCCYELLQGQFGNVVKDFGQPAKFDQPTTEIVERIGGIWTDQCLFFLKVDGNAAIYAALWPWSSDASKITLKAGTIQI